MHEFMNTSEGHLIECRAGIARGIAFAFVLDENAARSGFATHAAEGESWAESETQSKNVSSGESATHMRSSHSPQCACREFARASCRARSRETAERCRRHDCAFATIANRDLITPLKTASARSYLLEDQRNSTRKSNAAHIAAAIAP
jgi:hypothetical protein